MIFREQEEIAKDRNIDRSTFTHNFYQIQSLKLKITIKKLNCKVDSTSNWFLSSLEVDISWEISDSNCWTCSAIMEFPTILPNLVTTAHARTSLNFLLLAPNVGFEKIYFDENASKINNLNPFMKIKIRKYFFFNYDTESKS